MQIKTIKHQHQTMEEKLNTLRAGVLGSNDGILTVVGVLVSVAAATSNSFTIFIAGLSDLLACAFSMAVGEYASVSTQKDTERSVVAKEQHLLKTDFQGELEAVQAYYHSKGLTSDLSLKIAEDLMKKKPLATVLKVKYNIELGHYLDPWAAAFSSLFAAALGGILPLMAMTFVNGFYKWPMTIAAVAASSALTALISSKLGDGDTKVAIIRNIVIGLITIAIHYGVGRLF